MAATISANSAGGGGLVSSGDASGVLALQTEGVTALSIDASQKVTFANSLTSPTLITPVITGMGSSILTSGTVQTASSTAVNFTGIPSWAKRVTVMYTGVVTSAAAVPLIQLGTSGGIVTTGYDGATGAIANTSSCNASLITTGLGLAHLAFYTTFTGAAVFTLVTGNTWVGTLTGKNTTGISTGSTFIALSGTLTQLSLITNAAPTFTAGSINIMYE
jgi:hypothetical protein